MVLYRQPQNPVQNNTISIHLIHQLNKIMKAIQIVTLCLLLALLQGQIQPLNRLPTIPIRPILEILSSAECYEGSVLVSIERGTESQLTYFACFDEVTTNCNYQKCYNGWIANYTSEDTGLVQGYPANADVSPVFRLGINSAADFEIKKSPKLSEDFDRLIDIACSEFDPTVATPRILTASKSSFNANIRSASNSFLDVNLLKGQQISLQSQRDRTYIPEFSFVPSSGNLFSATAATQRIALSDLESEGASISRTLNYDSANRLVVDRSDLVSIQLSNSAVSESEDALGTPLIGQIALSLSQKGSARYNANNLEAALNRIGTTFSASELEERRADIRIIDLGGVAQADIQDEGKAFEEPNKQVFNLNQQLRLSTVSNLRLDALDQQFGNGRLLQQTVIFSKQTVLYQKTVLGKTIKVSILVVAKLTNNNQVLVITGTLKFNFFGKTKDIVVFSRSQNVNFNWSYSNTISGTWSFNIYVPLPPPVSFMGINFGFSASYSIPIQLGANGVASASVYTCTFFADVGAALSVDASAALRVIAVEGGVFIKGTLVSVRTDPKVILKYKYTQKILELTVDWKFYLRAFSFKWGFFWRYWKPFSWSGKKIIAEWTISNGIQKTYPVLSLFKTYQL